MSEQSPPNETVQGTEQASDVAEQTAPSGTAGSALGAWAICLLLGVVAAGASWGLVLKFGMFFDTLIPERLANLDMMVATDEEAREQLAAIQTARQRNTALALGMVGLVSAGLLGAAAGLARKSPGAALLGLPLGIVLGAAVGAAGGLAEFEMNRRLVEIVQIPETVRTILDHALAWGLVGAGVGLTILVVCRKSVPARRLMIAPIAAGVMGGILYTPLALIFLPLARPESVYPLGATNQLLWIGLPVVLIAVAVARVTGSRPKEAG